MLPTVDRSPQHSDQINRSSAKLRPQCCGLQTVVGSDQQPPPLVLVEPFNAHPVLADADPVVLAIFHDERIVVAVIETGSTGRRPPATRAADPTKLGRWRERRAAGALAMHDKKRAVRRLRLRMASPGVVAIV